MFRIVLLVYLFSAANGLLMLALDRALGFEGWKRRTFARRQSGRAASVLT